MLIVSVKGRMDVVHAPEFEKSMDRWINEGELRFIIDFSETVFISSAGLRSILVIAKKVETKGGKLSLAGPQDAVKRVFKISGFYSIIPIYDTVDAAFTQL